MPYGVVSLLEVLKFAAEDFWKASQLIAKWRADALDVRPKYAVVETIQTLTVLLEHLKKLDLPVSVREFEKLNSDMGKSAAHIETLAGEKGKQAYLKIKEENCTRMERMSSIIHSELESRVFFHVTPKEAAYYDQKELFGAEVNSKFSTIQYDMVEAGNCYAVGRGTSCVFHLMRIMEVGVQRFGAKLGVSSVADKNWQNILDELNKAIKTLPPKDPATVAMCQASANLYAVKLAWRNEVMHPNDKYTLEEAEDLIRAVNTFMKQVATII